MLLFKKKRPVQEWTDDTLTVSLPRGITFFHGENQRARYRLAVSDTDLKEVGAGMALFFLAEFFPDEKPDSAEKMQRAYKGARRALSKLGGNGDQAHFWWKAFNDGQIFHSHEDRLDIVCRVVWDRLFQKIPFKEHGPIRSFAYFLQVDMGSVKKVRLV